MWSKTVNVYVFQKFHDEFQWFLLVFYEIISCLVTRKTIERIPGFAIVDRIYFVWFYLFAAIMARNLSFFFMKLFFSEIPILVSHSHSHSHYTDSLIYVLVLKSICHICTIQQKLYLFCIHVHFCQCANVNSICLKIFRHKHSLHGMPWHAMAHGKYIAWMYLRIKSIKCTTKGKIPLWRPIIITQQGAFDKMNH